MLSFKHTYLLLAAALATFSLSAQNTKKDKSVLQDPSFSRGLAVESVSNADSLSGNLLVDTLAKPVWHLCQPNSRFDAARSTMESRGDNYIFNLAGNGNLMAKTVRLNPVRNILCLECNASAEYTGIRRSGSPWVGLWAEQRLDSVWIASCRPIELHLDYRITSFEDCMGFLADKDVHSAVCCATIVLRNANNESATFGRCLKVTLPLFDNRKVGASYGSDSYEEDGVAVYRPSSDKCLSSGRLPKVKQKESVQIRLMPIFNQALKAASVNDFLQDTDPVDYVLESFSIGWEMKGTFNSAVEIKNLKLLYL